MLKKSSEIIFNKDLSIYHLGLNTEDFADNIILVGDPKRVSFVSKYFDKIEIQKSKREFTTNTGYIGKIANDPQGRLFKKDMLELVNKLNSQLSEQRDQLTILKS